MTDRRIRDGLDAVLAHSPVQPWFSWRSRRRLTVLAYHGVDDPDRFEQHLDWLENHTQIVGASDVVDALNGRRPLPARAVLITFDDGDPSVLEYALPLLESRRLPAVAFVVTGVIDSTRPLWWREVEELVARGGTVPSLPSGLGPRDVVARLKGMPNQDRLAAIEHLRSSTGSSAVNMPQLSGEDLRRLERGGVAVGNHTRTHPILPRCIGAEIHWEIQSAHEDLRRLLGRAPRLFAYPNGDCDARSAEAVAACGYEAAFVFDHRQTRLPPTDRFRLSRVRINSDTSLNRFRNIVNGLHPAVHHLLGRS